ncbi:MAG: tetratricopeptide repeat protein [Verrucomicrobiota bacterium]
MSTTTVRIVHAASRHADLLSVSLQSGIRVCGLGFILAGISMQVYGTTVTEYMAEAQKFIDQKKYEHALELLQLAHKQHAGHHEITNLIGVLHIELDQYEDAERVMSELVVVAPNFARGHFNYGEMHFKQQNYPEARKHFQRSLDVRETDETGQTLFKLFLCDLLSGPSITDNHPSLSSEPDVKNPFSYYARSAFLFHAGEEVEAREWLQSAYDIYPLRMNLVYLDSLVTLGWVKAEKFHEMQAILDKRRGKSLAAEDEELDSEFELEAQVESEEQVTERLNEIESILPGLE